MREPRGAGQHDCLTGLWLTHGRAFSGSDRTLGTATKLVTGIDLPKGLGASDWSGDLSEEQIAYAALDALAARDIYQHTQDDLDADGRYVLALDDVVLEPIARAEHAGITLDVDAHQKLIAQWHATEAALTAQIVTLTGGTALATPRAVAAYLEQTLALDRLENWPLTASGTNLSTAKAHISRATDIPGIKELIDRTGVRKLLSNFAEAALANVNSVTGRVHTSFRCPGAKTGRMSSSRPNLQQIPKRQSKDARKSFVAAPGKVLVALDFSQMELRAASELSGDAAMKGVYDRGEDLHSTTAMAIAGNTDKDSRTLAKAINFGLLFGAGSATFAAATWAGWGIDLPVADAERHRETFFLTYAQFRQYQLDVTRDAEQRGYARTVCGRKWRWQWESMVQNDYTGEWSGFRYTLALNLPIQGSCAEVVKLAIANVEPAVRKHYGGQLILQVHDELIIEVDDDAEVVRSVIRLARAKMSAAFLEVFPNSTRHELVDAEVGRSWGSMTAAHTWLEASTMPLTTAPKENAHDT